jgi:hypothetical protein
MNHHAKSATHVLSNEGIRAVRVECSDGEIVQLTKGSQPEAIAAALPTAIKLYRDFQVKSPIRINLDDVEIGKISMQVCVQDGHYSAVLIDSGHAIAKSLPRLMRRALGKDAYRPNMAVRTAPEKGVAPPMPETAISSSPAMSSEHGS